MNNQNVPTKWINPRSTLVFELPIPLGLGNGGEGEIVKQTAFQWMHQPATSFTQLQFLAGVYILYEPDRQLTRQVRPDHFVAEWGDQPIIHETDFAELNAERSQILEDAKTQNVAITFADYNRHWFPAMLAFADAETDCEWPTEERRNKKLRFDRLLLQLINEQ